MALHQEDFVTLGSHLAARAAGIRPREGCTGWGVPRAFYARDVPGLGGAGYESLDMGFTPFLVRTHRTFCLMRTHMDCQQCSCAVAKGTGFCLPWRRSKDCARAWENRTGEAEPGRRDCTGRSVSGHRRVLPPGPVPSTDMLKCASLYTFLFFFLWPNGM